MARGLCLPLYPLNNSLVGDPSCLSAHSSTSLPTIPLRGDTYIGRIRDVALLESPCASGQLETIIRILIWRASNISAFLNTARLPASTEAVAVLLILLKARQRCI